MSIENLDEMLLRKTRHSAVSADWGSSYLENSAAGYSWQPETLCFSAEDYGTEIWRLTNTPSVVNAWPAITYGNWSADGKRIALLTNRVTCAYSVPSAYYAWFTVNTDGKYLRPIVSGASRLNDEDIIKHWDPGTPDVYYEFGRSISFTSSIPSSNVFYKVTVADLSESRTALFTMNSASTYLLSKSITRDGKYAVAFDVDMNSAYPIVLTGTPALLIATGYTLDRPSFDHYWGQDTCGTADWVTWPGLQDAYMQGAGSAAWLYILPMSANTPSGVVQGKWWRMRITGTASDSGALHTSSHTYPYTAWGNQLEPVNTVGFARAGSANDPWAKAQGEGQNVYNPGYLSNPAFDPWGRFVAFTPFDFGQSSARIWDSSAHTTANNICAGSGYWPVHHDWHAWSDYPAMSVYTYVDQTPQYQIIATYDFSGSSALIPLVKTHIRENSTTANTDISLARPTQSPDGTKIMYHSTMLNVANDLNQEAYPDLYYAVAYYPHPPEILEARMMQDVVKISVGWKLDVSGSARGYTNRGWPNESSNQPPPPREISRIRLWKSSDATNWEPVTTIDHNIFTRYNFASGNWASGYDSYWEIDDTAVPGTWYYAATSIENCGLESRTLSNVVRVIVTPATDTFIIPTSSIASAAGVKNIPITATRTVVEVSGGLWPSPYICLTADREYKLMDDVTATSGGFIISATRITINLNNKRLIYGQSASGEGISISAYNTSAIIIANGIIEQGAFAAEGDQYGGTQNPIYLSRSIKNYEIGGISAIWRGRDVDGIYAAGSGIIHDNTLNDIYGLGSLKNRNQGNDAIRARYGDHNTRVYNNVIINARHRGIQTDSSARIYNNYITCNTIATNGYGIFGYATKDCSAYCNFISSVGEHPLAIGYVSEGTKSNRIFSNFTITQTTRNGTEYSGGGGNYAVGFRTTWGADDLEVHHNVFNVICDQNYQGTDWLGNPMTIDAKGRGLMISQSAYIACGYSDVGYYHDNIIRVNNITGAGKAFGIAVNGMNLSQNLRFERNIIESNYANIVIADEYGGCCGYPKFKNNFIIKKDNYSNYVTILNDYRSQHATAQFFNNSFVSGAAQTNITLQTPASGYNKEYLFGWSAMMQLFHNSTPLSGQSFTLCGQGGYVITATTDASGYANVDYYEYTVKNFSGASALNTTASITPYRIELISAGSAYSTCAMSPYWDNPSASGIYTCPVYWYNAGTYGTQTSIEIVIDNRKITSSFVGANSYDMTCAQISLYPDDPKGKSDFYTTKPYSPSNLSAVRDGGISAHFHLTWSEPSNSANMNRYYNLYYSNSGIPSALQQYRVASLPVGTSSYRDWNADPNVDGYYLITTVNYMGIESVSAGEPPPSGSSYILLLFA